MSNDRKVLVIGLDCATPQLVFDQWKGKLPNLKKLIDGGSYGPLESTIPPITVPAWMSMMTSKDPGTLGFYGFRNRKNYSYDEMFFATSTAVKEKTVWDLLSEEGKKSIVVGVPPAYPPRPLNGNLLSCFLTPGPESDYTYPKELKSEIVANCGGYIFDVMNFRTDDKEKLLRDIDELAENRFKVTKYLMQNKEWDFCMFVEMGVDRIHHGFWKYFDKEHVLYEPGSKYENAIQDFYVKIDQMIGELLSIAGDDTVVLVVSDHGAKRMDGGLCFNEWLMQEGYLTLKQKPEGRMQVKHDNIDWSKTKAWGSGGYYGRLFMNVQGREPSGVIPKEDYEKVRSELVEKLEALTDMQGKVMGTRAYRPEEIYSTVNNIAPDLIVLFGDLFWRSVGTVGFGTIHTLENDTGPDDANHAQHGIFIMYDPRGQKNRGKLEGTHLMDVGPTILSLFGIEPPRDMRGKIVK